MSSRFAFLALACMSWGGVSTTSAQEVRISPYEEPDPERRSETGFLVIRTVPDECTLSCEAWKVAGYEKKDERVNAVHLPPGEATVVFVAGETTFSQVLEVEAGQERHLTFDLAAREVHEDVSDLVVQASEEIIVFVDGKERGRTSTEGSGLVVRHLKAGEHRVSLKRFGYEPIEETVVIERSTRTDLWPDTSSARPTYWTGTEVPREDSFRKATWRIGVRARVEDVTVTCEALALAARPLVEGFEIAGVHAEFFSLTFQYGDRVLRHELFPSVSEATFLSLDFEEERIHVNTGDVAIEGAENVQLHLKGRPWNPVSRGSVRHGYDLEPGTYELRAEREAHHARETTFEVEAGRVTKLALEPLLPILAWFEGEGRPSAEQMQVTAGLYLAGLAKGARVTCDALGLDRVVESASAVRVYGLPEGTHAFAVDGATFQATFRAGQRVRLRKEGDAFRPLPPTPEDYRRVATLGKFERDPGVGLAIHPAGRFVVAATRDRHLSVFDLEGMRAVARWASEWPLIDVVFCEGGERLVALHRNDQVALFDRLRGRALHEIGTGGAINYAVHSLEDPNTVVTVAWDNRRTYVKFLGSDGSERRGFSVKERLERTAVHPLGSWLAANAGGAEVLVYDARSGERVERLTRHRQSVTALAFSPDGELLATGSDDDTIRLWDTRTWKTGSVLRGPRLSPQELAFSPDGRWLAAVGDDVWIFEVATGEVVTVLATNESQTTAIAFLPDGSGCVTAGRAKTLQVWRVPEETTR